ncbi:MAG: multicopper oxidase domain-containing protein [Terriglobales bacterium]
MVRHLGPFGVIFLVVCSAWSSPTENPPLPQVVANDNRTAAGQVKNGVLELHLELRQGRWYPEDETGQSRDVYAFAEAGHAPQSSGPLIRVPQGTQIHAAVHNALPLAAKIHGLHRHPGDAKDALKLAPDETREVQFLAGEPGTYLYWATTSDKSLENRDDAETMLSGAFVVDVPGAQPHDRIFVLGVWSKSTTAADFEEILSINGKTWPYTERLTYKIGETTHWRVINPTASDHGMHLHGFYFKVDGVGDGEHYEHYAEEQRRLAVTEHIESGHVFEVTWTPERAGNWLFHCHMVGHMSPSKALAPKEQPASYPSEHDHGMGMGGLVLGITVLPGATAVQVPTAATGVRKLQLVISDNPLKIPLYSIEVNDPLKPAAAADKKMPPSLLGPPIILTQGEATEIEVKNQSTSPTAIHWHGIELESYYDGVAGWTGSGQQTTPPVAPGTSFIARMTPPRAGTFIYHTHWHDDAQLRNGLYGPLIVLEPGQKYDPEHDRSFVFSIGKYDPLGFMLLVNGKPEPYPVKLKIGTRYRLRFMNITDNISELRVRLTTKDVPVQWKVIAKDGADLPPAQLKYSTADMGITVGETYDVEYQTETAGFASLQIWLPSFPVTVTQPLQFAEAK